MTPKNPTDFDVISGIIIIYYHFRILEVVDK